LSRHKVPTISQKSDDIWTFRCYHLGDGIHGWYDALSGRAQAKVDTALGILAVMPQWDRQALYDDLHGFCEGLGEIRIEVPMLPGEKNGSDGVHHYRILGFKGPGRREFTLLFPFKKSDNFQYGDACKAALKRKDGVKRDGSRAPICSFP
jgi:hypothetical protein